MTSPSFLTLACVGLLALTSGSIQRSAAQGVPLIPAAAATVLLGESGGSRTGATSADVVLVEFFDYNCPYCKRLAPALQSLLQLDTRVAVIYKDWPILGETSVYASRMALAAEWQGKYLTVHNALISGPRLTSAAQVDAALQTLGLDLKKLKQDEATHSADIDERLARIDAQAHALGIRGTPGLFVGRQPVAGNADVAQLQLAVAAARQSP